MATMCGTVTFELSDYKFYTLAAWLPGYLNFNPFM